MAKKSEDRRDDLRAPYEPPVVRELGKVAEVTRGVGAPGTDITASI